MAGTRLGYRRGLAIACGGTQLLASAMVLGCIQIFYCAVHGGLPAVLDLASYWSLTHIWFPVSQGCVYHDVYVRWFPSFRRF